MSNKNIKLKRFGEEEKVVLRDFVKSHEAAGKSVAYSELAGLSLSLDKINGNLGRVPSRLWDALKRFGGMVTQSKRASRASEKTIKKIANSGTVAKKVLEELTPIIKFMGKPPEYLRPLELLLSEHQLFAEHLRVAEEKNAAIRASSKTARAAVSSAKSANKKMKQMEKELKTLRNFLIPAKILLRETCSLRLQAAVLTQRTEDLKKKNGTNLFEFLKELEERNSLKE